MSAADKHGNVVAKEGVDFCWCGCKYWEFDHCVDCGSEPGAAKPEECEHGLSAWLCEGPNHYPDWA